MTKTITRPNHSCGTPMLLTQTGWLCPKCTDSRIVPLKLGDTFRVIAHKHPDWCIVSTVEPVKETECDVCNGIGEVECSDCDGTGEDECGECGSLVDCETCDGVGRVDCDECDGTGKTEA